MLPGFFLNKLSSPPNVKLPPHSCCAPAEQRLADQLPKQKRLANMPLRLEFLPVQRAESEFPSEQLVQTQWTREWAASFPAHGRGIYAGDTLRNGFSTA